MVGSAGQGGNWATDRIKFKYGSEYFPAAFKRQKANWPDDYVPAHTHRLMNKAWKFNQMKARGNYALNTIN